MLFRFGWPRDVDVILNTNAAAGASASADAGAGSGAAVVHTPNPGVRADDTPVGPAGVEVVGEVDEYVCDYTNRMECWSSQRGECILLKAGRVLKPESVGARAGGSASTAGCKKMTRVFGEV